MSFWSIIEEEANDTLEEDVIDLTLQAIAHYQQGLNPSKKRRRRSYIERNREDGHNRLFNDYFSDNPVYTDVQFRRKFRMRRNLFLRIVDALSNHSSYFQIRTDAIGRTSLSPLQKCIAAIRILAYGSPADSVDEYVPIGESTACACLVNFVECVNEIFGAEYLRRPNVMDMERLLRIGESRGFPGMLGSVNCMHWEWNNCPTSWKAQFTRDDHDKPTIMLEVVASQDLWIWHTCFGTLGANNDINVLNQSTIFNDVLADNAPQVKVSINDTEYNTGYYLADDIYPEWPTFVKTIHIPLDAKTKLFAKHQETAKKDVERAFKVLRDRFAIIMGIGRQWQMNILKNIINACIILHNMIVEDERDSYNNHIDYKYDTVGEGGHTPIVSQGVTLDFATYLHRSTAFRERIIHHQLQANLIEHIWHHFSDEDAVN